MPRPREKPTRKEKPTPSGGAPSTPGNAGDQSPVSTVGATGKGAGHGSFSSTSGHHTDQQSMLGGPVPAETPHPYEPHTYVPVPNVPDGNECISCHGPSDSPWH